jgi:hypothetical protein
MYKVEYLLIFIKDNNFCIDIDSLKSYISSHQNIKIEKNKIEYKEEKFELKIELKDNEKT